MAPEERKRHRGHGIADATHSDSDGDDNGALVVTQDELVDLASQYDPNPEPEPTPYSDSGLDSKIRHGTYDIHRDPKLQCRVLDFIGDIDVCRVRPAIRCPFHTSPVQSPHRVEIDTPIGGLASAKWGRLPRSDLVEEATHESLSTICSASLAPSSQNGAPQKGRVYVYQYTLNKAKANTSLRNDDGAFAFIPQAGPITLDTELGLMELRVGDIGVVPAGIHFSMSPARAATDFVEGGFAGYVLEVVGASFNFAADSDFAVASGPRSHEHGPVEEASQDWTHFVKDSKPPRPLVLPSYSASSTAMPAWIPPNPPPSQSATLWQSSTQREDRHVGRVKVHDSVMDGRTNPLGQYTLAHGPLDVVAWEVERTRCADLPYKVRLVQSRPEQRSPWPVLRADLGGGHVAELHMFSGWAGTPPWPLPDGVNCAYGVIRDSQEDLAWHGLHGGDLVVQASGARGPAVAAASPGSNPDLEHCEESHGLLGFLFAFPGELGFTDWAVSEHPAKISSVVL